MRALDDIFVCLRNLDVLDLIAARIHGYPSRIEENKKPRQSSFSRIMSVNHVQPSLNHSWVNSPL